MRREVLLTSSVTVPLVTLVAATLRPQQVLTLHLPLLRGQDEINRNDGGPTHLETSDVSVTEIFAKLLDLLQLQQVYPQHLYGYDHQVIHLLVTREKSFLVFLLMLKLHCGKGGGGGSCGVVPVRRSEHQY